MKIIQFIPSVLALAAIGFGHFSFWCTSIDNLCYRTWLDSIFLEIINPLYFFFLFSLPIAIVLAFVPRGVFNSWLKLAAWAIPLLVLFIAVTPVNFTGLGMDFFPFYRDDAARLAGEIFAGVSLVLIIWKLIVAHQTQMPGLDL